MSSNSKPEFFINPSRFKYLLDLYRLNLDQFLSLINKDRKRDLFDVERINRILNKDEKVNESFLKRFDAIFDKGLTWVISKRDLHQKRNSSIFFRKDSFNTYLNLESKKKISFYEELKFELETLCKQIDFKPKRIFGNYKISDNPKIVAKEIRNKFDEIEKELVSKKYISKPKTDRNYLQNLIRILEHFNIFVFEFIDRSRLLEKKIYFNGFFMLPSIIVLKRQQKYLRREIFTLLHEFAHYLLKVEEVDEVIELNKSNKVEIWCNHFTYSFLIKGFEEEFSDLTNATKENNFYQEEITELYNKTYLSRFALYTRLKLENKISEKNYNKIKNDILENIKKREQEKKIRLREEKLFAKEWGKDFFIPTPKEIKSKLFEEIVKINFFQGNINENKLRKYLKIKSDQSIEEVIY